MSEKQLSNLDSASQMKEAEINLLDLATLVIDNLKLLIIGSLSGGVVVLGFSFLMTPIYSAKTQFLPPQQQQSTAASLVASLGALGGLAGATAGIKNPAEQYVAFMKSVSVQDAIIDRFNLTEKYNVQMKVDARLSLADRVRILSAKDGLISVEVEDSDPKIAADLANAHVEELRNLMGRLAVTEAQHRRMFFEKQLQVTKENLLKAEVALKSSGINSSVLKSSPISAVEAIARLKAGISVQEVKLGAMRNYLTEYSPEFKKALGELSSLKAELARAEKAEPAEQNTSDYVGKFREFKYQETMFELFAKQYELAKIDESREGAVIQVLDVAQPPERKVKPKKALLSIIASTITGFILLLFVIVRSAIQKALDNPENFDRIQVLKHSLRNALRI